MKDRNLSIRPLNGKMRLIHGLLFRLLLSLKDVDEVIEECAADADEDADEPSTTAEADDKDVNEF